MKNLLLKYKRELVYSSYIFLIFELLVTRTFVYSYISYLLVSLAGLILIASWIFVVHISYGSKKVSKWSGVLLKVSFKERLYANVVLPILFYSSICVFLFVDVSKILNQVVILGSVILIFIMMLHIRTAYEKVFTIERVTRYVNNLINISIFFIVTTVLMRLALPFYVTLILTYFLSLYILMFMLVQFRKVSISSIVMSVASALVITSSMYFLQYQYTFASSAICSTLLFLMISLWSIRFNGATKMEEYIPPILYSAMALILVLSL